MTLSGMPEHMFTGMSVARTSESNWPHHPWRSQVKLQSLGIKKACLNAELHILSAPPVIFIQSSPPAQPNNLSKLDESISQ